jgi:hypothetical protein
MKLHNLVLQKAQHTKKKELAAVKLPDMVVHLQKVIRVDKAVPVIKEKERTKVARCLSSVVFQSVVSKIRTG